jgi:hypothetical protein
MTTTAGWRCDAATRPWVLVLLLVALLASFLFDSEVASLRLALQDRVGVGSRSSGVSPFGSHPTTVDNSHPATLVATCSQLPQSSPRSTPSDIPERPTRLQAASTVSSDGCVRATFTPGRQCPRVQLVWCPVAARAVVFPLRRCTACTHGRTPGPAHPPRLAYGPKGRGVAMHSTSSSACDASVPRKHGPRLGTLMANTARVLCVNPGQVLVHPAHGPQRRPVPSTHEPTTAVCPAGCPWPRSRVRCEWARATHGDTPATRCCHWLCCDCADPLRRQRVACVGLAACPHASEAYSLNY